MSLFRITREDMMLYTVPCPECNGAGYKKYTDYIDIPGSEGIVVEGVCDMCGGDGDVCLEWVYDVSKGNELAYHDWMASRLGGMAHEAV